MWLANAVSRISYGLYALVAKLLGLPLLLAYDILLTVGNSLLPSKRGPVTNLWSGDVKLWPQYIAPQPSDSRSPCVALNCMANMGILPRDGRNIAFPDLERAVMQTYNTSSTFARLVTKYAADMLLRDYKHDTLDLSDLCVHNGIEHDASFTRESMRRGAAISDVALICAQDTTPRLTQTRAAPHRISSTLCWQVQRERTTKAARVSLSEISFAYLPSAVQTGERVSHPLVCYYSDLGPSPNHNNSRARNPQFTQSVFHKLLGSSSES